MGTSEADAAAVRAAREAFNAYAGMDAPDLPADPISALQVRLFRWQTRNFGLPNQFEILAGATEELGELAHALLKHRQGIRGYGNEKTIVEAGDAIGDEFVYIVQLCTSLRLDFGTLFKGIAENVLRRDWVADPQEGGAA